MWSRFAIYLILVYPFEYKFSTHDDDHKSLCIFTKVLRFKLSDLSIAGIRDGTGRALKSFLVKIDQNVFGLEIPARCLHDRFVLLIRKGRPAAGQEYVCYIKSPKTYARN